MIRKKLEAWPEELPLTQGQGRRPRVPGWTAQRWPRGATTCPRSGEAAKRSNPTSKEWWLRKRRKAERSYSTFKVRRGGREEIPLIQGKEQGLCFAGAAEKRYPTSEERETQVRW